MKKMVLGLMVVAGLLGTSTVVANAADTTTGETTGDVAFSKGTLSMSVDNTNLSFGTENTISVTDEHLGTSTAPKVKVSDLRGTNEGWSLNVAQGQQFNTETNGSGSELTNAALMVISTEDSSDSTVNVGSATLNPGKTTSGTTTNGAAFQVASASAGHGNGISKFSFGSSKLFVPGATPKLSKGYTTKLTWSLNATPSNE